MTVEFVQSFLMWSTIINFGLLLFSSVMMIVMGDTAYRIHNRWFPMPRETFNVVIYSLLGFYKIMIFIFNLVPWIAITILLSAG